MKTTTEVAATVGVVRRTVEREIKRGNLAAEKVGRSWVIKDEDAEQWAADFRPYAGLRKP